MSLRQSLWHLIPPRIRAVFSVGPELRIESPLPPDELARRIQDSLISGWAWTAMGAYGQVDENRLCLGWRNRLSKVTAHPVFVGGIEPVEAGSIIIGRITLHRFVRLFLALWCGCLVLIGLLLVWTLIMPLAVWGMLWLLNGLLAIESESADQWAQSIVTHLHEVATSPSCPVPAEQGGTPRRLVSPSL